MSGQARARQELTPEMRRSLAGYFPFSRGAAIDYTPSVYEQKKQVWNKEKEEFEDTAEFKIPDGYRPVFSVRSFTKGEYDLAHQIMQEEVQDKDNKKTLELAVKTRELVRTVVSGWTDLIDLASLKEVTYKADSDGGADKDLWSNMPDWIYTDIRNYVYRISGILPGERLSLK